ncbi:CubicO group peptidase, beta-lactamase class C family [Streptomyces zhaozhouensis]|uniref:CubicO group peptidase, beta-lactamase class C family n=1 Tax=Streptomyces zhaozhouensis TaxID=1300267 RepID=A0A286DYR3_9ACTN|nr:serine hydrolase domain-containing protein [Streptomyces zhaozhouensis]SOD63791.1 CubicO group peptidase, beta-lactamase class C family [Streptomyces zhaozhouensis]
MTDKSPETGPRNSAGNDTTRVAPGAAFLEPLPGTRRELAHRVAVCQSEGRAPALVATVARDGTPVWSGGAGELPAGAAPERVRFRIASISKSLTAVLVLRLRDEGLIELDQPVERWLPTPHAGGATVAQLLAHTAGLAAESAGPWWERTPGELRPELPDLFGPDQDLHPAGRRFHYSNPGYALLGALVERLRGEPWFTVLRREVLEPLGMERTSYDRAEPAARGWAVHPHADLRQPEPEVDTGRMAPAGQLWSTTEDLCAFAAFLTGHHPAADAVLGADSRAEMRTSTVPLELTDLTSGYGLGLQVVQHEGRQLFGHGGSLPGFLAGVWFDPEQRTAAAVLANATAGPAVRTLTFDLLGTLRRREPSFPEPWRPAADADPALLPLTGDWYWGTAAHTLRLDAAGGVTLYPAGGSGRGSRFRRVGPDAWLGLDAYYAGERLTVQRGADGRVTHLDVGTFVFTRAPYEPEAPVPGGSDPAGWTA